MVHLDGLGGHISAHGLRCFLVFLIFNDHNLLCFHSSYYVHVPLRLTEDLFVH